MASYNITINKKTTVLSMPQDKIKDVLDHHFSPRDYNPFIAIKNHRFASLNETITDHSRISVTLDFHESSKRAYENTAILILVHCINHLFPEKKLHVLHSMCDGVYCEFDDGGGVSREDIHKIKSAFHNLVEQDLPIYILFTPKIEAYNYFSNINQHDTADLIKYCSQNFIPVYTLKETKYWLPSPVAPSTGVIDIYDIKKYDKGFVLRCPVEGERDKLQPFRNQDRLYEIFTEFVKWGKILGFNTIHDINDTIIHNDISNIIKIAEALQEKKIALIADKIHNKGSRLVFIAGPSSSGKTTFSKKLSIQLQVLGFDVIMISLDDYFKDRRQLKKEQGGDLNFEVLEALDLELLNNHIQEGLAGKSICPPSYNYISGKKEKGGGQIYPTGNTVFVFEGIHGINPGLVHRIKEDLKFKIYISALTHLNYDNYNRISTHDTRLIRRIVRDSKYRGYEAADTIQVWKKVVEGEKKYIFKYQGCSDIMFNSSLVYEMGVLKNYAEEALKKVPFRHPSHPEADRLLDFLSYYLPIKVEDVPRTSILREFIGNSAFKY